MSDTTERSMTVGTLARMAGNIAAGILANPSTDINHPRASTRVAKASVEIAQEIARLLLKTD